MSAQLDMAIGETTVLIDLLSPEELTTLRDRLQFYAIELLKLSDLAGEKADQILKGRDR